MSSRKYKQNKTSKNFDYGSFYIAEFIRYSDIAIMFVFRTAIGFLSNKL